MMRLSKSQKCQALFWYIVAGMAILWAVALLAASLKAQQSNVVYKKVFNGITAPTASAPIENIGQMMHVIQVSFPAEVAAVSGIQVRIEASYDNVRYFPISSDIISCPLLAGKVYSFQKAYGPFPYVRVRNVIDTGGKLMTVVYSGHLNPVVPFVSEFSDRFVL